MIKVCRNCGRELPLSEFYKHSRMADGHLNHCKECVRARISRHREQNVEYFREYDRNRPNKKERMKRSNERQVVTRHTVKGYTKCHNAVERAVAKGTLVRPDRCCICDEKVKTEAHHPDYSKPLDVVWLCTVCHKQLHNGKNKQSEAVRMKVAKIISIRTVEVKVIALEDCCGRKTNGTTEAEVRPSDEQNLYAGEGRNIQKLCEGSGYGGQAQAELADY